MALQTFTVGQVLTAAQVTALQNDNYNQTVSTKTSNHILVAADVGTRVYMNAAGSTTITVNTGIFAAGDTLFLGNIGAGSCVVTAGTATVSKFSTASLTLSQYQGAYLYFVSTGVAILYSDSAGSSTPLTTKGDLFGFSTLNARVPIGTNNQVLTADSAEALGLKWATASSGGMTSLASGSLSGNTLSLTSISGSYKDLQLLLRDVGIDAQSPLNCKFNGLTANYFDSNYGHHTTTTAYNQGNVNTSNAQLGGYENQVANTSVTAHVLDFFDYTSNDVKICRKSGYVDGRFSTPYLYNSTFGNYSSGARAAITSITITVENGGNFNNGTYILYGVS